MLAAGASKTNGQITLAFPDVVGNQVDQQLRDAVNEFLGLQKRADVFSYAGMASCKRAEFRNKMGIGQETYIKEQVGFGGHSRFIAKAHTGNHDVFFRAARRK